MPEEALIQLFLVMLAASVGAMLLLPLLSGLIGWLCTRLRLPGWLVPVGTLGTVAGLVLVGSLYLDTTGIVVPGEVQAREERIATRSSGSGAWTRHLTVAVRYTTTDGLLTMATISVDEARFDALRTGAPVRVRYLPEVRAIARLADQSTWTLLPPEALHIAGFVAALIAGAWILVRRRALWPVAGVLVIVGLGGLVPLLLPVPWEPEPPGPWRTATADVRAVRTITDSMLSTSRSPSRAPQPWHLVELVFVPAGRDQPVVAVDGVDRGTVTGLTQGARLAIRYPEAAPRAARLVAGERTYRLREWEQLGRDIFWFGVVIAGTLALTAVLNRFWRRLLARRAHLLAEVRRPRDDQP